MVQWNLFQFTLHARAEKTSQSGIYSTVRKKVIGITQRIPAHWKQRLSYLREDIQRAINRWLPKHRLAERRDEAERWLPMRWSEPMGQFREDLQQTLDRWWSRGIGQKRREDEEWLPLFFVDGGPAVDLEETEDDVLVFAAMPGLNEEEFTVKIIGDHLILQGEKKYSSEGRRWGTYYAERSYGTFARRIALPCEVDAERATAKYKNGLLRITLPKTEQAKSRRIRVKVYG